MKKAIVISGPTASGKTDLAIRLARFYNTEIISADSRQLYKELNIGSAKPTTTELNAVRHHFINIRNVSDEYNAGLFEKEALQVIEDLFKNHDVVIICGGSGLYLNALLFGFDDLPDGDPEIRKMLIKKYDRDGIEFLQNEIEKLDPDFAATADMNNPQRLIRALEICMSAKKPFSGFKTGKKSSRPFTIHHYCLNPVRESLYNRINARVDEMFNAGLIEEVNTLLPYRHLNALQTVGYKEVFEYLDGLNSLEKTVELVKQHTRNYAKRQMTWFRRNKDVIYINPSNALEEILNLEQPV